jgi:putative hydrolase of the HAD superfamily
MLNLITVSQMVIFLDAVGTLFGVKGGVGYAYSVVAARFGVDCDRTELDQAFIAAFRSSPPLAFPDLALEEIPEAEYRWWYEVALRTFAKTGDLARFRDFDGFFKELFGYFATAEPWFVYEDTVPALERWRSQGVELGIISNFDSRLYSVLRELGIDGYFSSVTISTEAGSAKPDPQIFLYALTKHPNATTALHIGDSYLEDYQGAIASGLQAVWLDREGKGQEYEARINDRLLSLEL